MAMTSEELYQLRTWLPWNPPTDTDLNARWDVLSGDFWGLVIEQLRRQLMLALTVPGQFSIAGEYGQTTKENIDGIRAAMKDAEQEALAGVGGISVASLVRPNPYAAGRTPLAGQVTVGATRLL